jgi:hypothetical protein
MLMMVVPGTNLGFGDYQHVKIQPQQIRVVQSEVNDKVEKGKRQYQGHRQAVSFVFEHGNACYVMI